MAFWSAVTGLDAVRAPRRGGPVPDAAAAGGSGVRQDAGRRRPGRRAPRPRLRPTARRPSRALASSAPAPALDLPRRRGDALPRRPGLLPHAAATASRALVRDGLDRPRPGVSRRPGGALGGRGRLLVRARPAASRRRARCPSFVRLVEHGTAPDSSSSASASPTGRSAPTPTSPPADREADTQRARTPRRARSSAVHDFWTVLTAPGGQVYCLTDRDPGHRDRASPACDTTPRPTPAPPCVLSVCDAPRHARPPCPPAPCSSPALRVLTCRDGRGPRAGASRPVRCRSSARSAPRRCWPGTTWPTTCAAPAESSG